MSLSGIGFDGEDAQSELAKFKWTEIATSFADEWGPNILANLRAQAPVAPTGGGRLRDALRFERHTSIGHLSMIFSDDVPYFKYVISGTVGGQIINPVAARALHWTSAGADFFAASVIRGATPKNDFPQRVWDRMAPEVATGFREAIEEGMAT
jgi:hypothetical protein